MKRNNPYLLAAALLAVAFTGCKNDEYDNKSPFDNVVYLNVSENSDTQVTTFKKTLPDLPKTFSVVLSYPASQAASKSIRRWSKPTMPGTIRRGRCSMRNIMNYR